MQISHCGFIVKDFVDMHSADMLSHLQHAWAWAGVQEIYQKAYKQVH